MPELQLLGCDGFSSRRRSIHRSPLKLFLECFQHFFAEMRHESLDSLNLNFAHGTAGHDDALAALSYARRFINESIEAVPLKFSANSLSDLCGGDVHNAEAYHRVFALSSPRISDAKSMI